VNSNCPLQTVLVDSASATSYYSAPTDNSTNSTNNAAKQQPHSTSPIHNNRELNHHTANNSIIYNNRSKNIIIQPPALASLASSGKEWKSSGLHPSWAAKQLNKQQAILKIPLSISSATQVGKKIKFDVDD